jgi:hypothetical protein
VTAKTSKFSSIFDANQVPEPEQILLAPDQHDIQRTNSATSFTVVTETASHTEPQTAKLTGRATNGKKSDPRYKQVTAYVRKDLHRNVTDALYDEARGRDTKRKEFSELVDELLELWWKEQQKRPNKTS